MFLHKIKDLQLRLEGIAIKLCKDPFLRDDILQEMYVRILEMDDGHTDAYYLQSAKHRAIDFLRKYFWGRKECKLGAYLAEKGEKVVLRGSSDWSDQWKAAWNHGRCE